MTRTMFGSSPSAKQIKAMTGKKKSNDPRYKHRGRQSAEKLARQRFAVLEKQKQMMLRRANRKK